MKTFLYFLLISSFSFSQNNDSLFIRTIYNSALSNGKAYEDLRELCKNIGSRLSGSPEAEMAIQWGKNKMESYGFDKVYLQEIKVPHWERGTKEVAWIKTKKNKIIKMHILALGGSVPTNGLIESNIIEFKHIEDLKKAKEKDVKGKIVFLNQKMDEKEIITFKAYGGCYMIRGEGAVEASKLGATGVIIRSLNLSIDQHPHTGTLHYEDSIQKIPAAAISTEDAEFLSNSLKESDLKFCFEMDCINYPDITSYNVIGEISGKTEPNKIITFGGHLDSWDVGEGAHDDGTGIIHTLEALRILNSLNYRPNYTLRVVFFMNEENGNRGGISYANWSKEKGEEQIAAIESDRGGFAPRGFHCDGTIEQIALLKSFASLLKPYELHIFEKGYGGVDIGPIKKSFTSTPLFGFIPDSQRYFDFHHAENDVFENVNKRELELGCAAIASLVYLLDRNLK